MRAVRHWRSMCESPGMRHCRDESNTTTMWHGSNRLFQHQAFVGHGWEYSPTPTFDGNGVMIKRLIETKQRKLETVLPTRFSMTAARVASVAAKQWLDLVSEVDGVWRNDVFRRNRQVGGLGLRLRNTKPSDEWRYAGTP